MAGTSPAMTWLRLCSFPRCGSRIMTQTNWPNLRESDFIIRDFRFASGETLPELRQHFITLRRRRRADADAADPQHHRHGEDWLEPGSPANCSARASRSMPRGTFIIIPDIIGFGRSSKPSDGLRARFPHYRCTTSRWRSIVLSPKGLNIPHLQAGDGAVARRHAELDVRRDVSGFHGGAGPGREPARPDERPQLDSAPHQRRGDPQRSGVEQRRL